MFAVGVIGGTWHGGLARQPTARAELMRELGRRQINELHVEAGFKLNGSLLREGCVDELLLYLAPTLLGPAMGMANLPALESLSARQSLRFHEVRQIGPDLRILARFTHF